MPELSERVARAVGLGAEELFGRQRSDGAFGDDPPSSVLGTAGAITALRLADPAGSTELVSAGSRWLRSAQLPDGGWGGVTGADSEPVATSVAAATLQLVDPGGSAEAIAAGRARLEQFGGIAAVTDPAVLLLCKTFLMLAGFLQPSDLRRLPLEIVLFDRVRRQNVSFRTAPFAAMALAQSVTDPARGLRGLTSRLARGKALRLLREVYEHEGRTGDFSEDPWPAALVCLSLARAGLAPDMVAASAGYLRRSVRPDGSWDAVSNLDLTRSGFAATGLIAAGYAADPRLEATRQLFHRCQQREEFTVLACPPGGWSFSGPRGWPVTLESAEIIAALAGLPEPEGDAALRTGLDWLRGRQDSRGSWSLWVRDTKLANDGPCPSITSQAITALLDAGVAADSPEVSKAADWLLTQPRPDGSFDNLWYRDHTTGTAAVLAALARAGRGGHPVAGPVVDKARQWLLDAQRPDGSWGDGAQADSSVEETAWALHALLEAGLDPASEPVCRAVDWLVTAQLPTGGWQPSRICAYIRHHMHYPNGAITRGLALRALGLYLTKASAAATVHPASSAPGQQPSQQSRQQRGVRPMSTHDLSMNESRFGPLPSVRAVVEQGAAQLHRYPSHTAAGLVSALAEHLDVPATEVLVGPGSAGLTQNLIASLGPERTEVVYAALSFEAYPLMVLNTGCRPVPVPLAGASHDLDAMAAAITDQTRCVLICNPNNPTGTVLSEDELSAFLDRVPASVPVIIDEAYREFVTDPDAADGMRLRAGRDNVCVLRTFSKAYGLATLRVGYAVAPEAIAQRARMTGLVFYPGGLAQAAAVASLAPAAEKQVLQRCAEFAGVRAQFIEDLRAAGLPVGDSQANFVWLPIGVGAEDFAARCQAAGVLVRTYPGVGVRVTVGTDEANRLLLGVAVAG